MLVAGTIMKEIFLHLLFARDIWLGILGKKYGLWRCATKGAKEIYFKKNMF